MVDISRITEAVAELLRYNPASPMIFSSGIFLFLFAGFTLFYSFMRRTPVLRMVYVSLFSIYFYYKTGGLYFFLLILVSVTDFVIGRLLAATEAKPYRRGLVALSVLINLGMLAYFKYTNLFIQIANDLAGHDVLAFRNIFLPVGISFFVFQSMSYTIDIYRRQLTPLTCWLDYFFYLSFFPQLVAGPIVRARDFIPQIRQNPLRVTREMFGRGLFLIMTGLVKKAVISDYISVNFVDRVFDNPMLYSGFENLMGVYGYALQIYCDFSGYSDMAIGIALLLGFRFPKNFDSPYKSATITEFWRRWHISLGSWFRDYVYIPLGGSRVGKARWVRNLVIVWGLTGLWHGAAWNFVAWGLYFAAFLLLEKLFLGRWLKRVPVLGHVYVLLAALFSFVLFDAASVPAALETAGGLLGLGGLPLWDSGALYYLRSYAPVLALAAVGSTPLPAALCRRIAAGRAGRVLDALEPAALLALLAVCTAFLVSGSANPFLYFRF